MNSLLHPLPVQAYQPNLVIGDRGTRRGIKAHFVSISQPHKTACGRKKGAVLTDSTPEYCSVCLSKRAVMVAAQQGVK